MSYEKVKSICIDEEQGKVFITCGSNNVRPLRYDRQEFPYFSNLLKEKGRQEVEIALLKDYESGNLQQGKNKFTYALKVLRYVYGEEYNKFSWRNSKTEEERKVTDDFRNSQEFNDLLLKCLNYKPKKESWVIYKDYFGEKVFGKLGKWSMKWVRDKNKASKFDFEKEAVDNIFQNYKKLWKAELLK